MIIIFAKTKEKGNSNSKSTFKALATTVRTQGRPMRNSQQKCWGALESRGVERPVSIYTGLRFFCCLIPRETKHTDLLLRIFLCFDNGLSWLDSYYGGN